MSALLAISLLANGVTMAVACAALYVAIVERKRRVALEARLRLTPVCATCQTPRFLDHAIQVAHVRHDQVLALEARVAKLEDALARAIAGALATPPDMPSGEHP